MENGVEWKLTRGEIENYWQVKLGKILSLGRINLGSRNTVKKGKGREFKAQNSHDLGRRGRVIRPIDPWFKKYLELELLGELSMFQMKIFVLKYFSISLFYDILTHTMT